MTYKTQQAALSVPGYNFAALLPEGWVPVVATISGPLAVHQSACNHNWNLTHAPTGCLIWSFRSQGAAFVALQQIAPLARWDWLNRSTAKQVPALWRAVQQICSELEHGKAA